jgi:hypothetical protein
MTLQLLSFPALTINSSFFVKLTLQTELLWKLKLFISDPEETSQTIIKESDDPETMCFPSLEYRTQFTYFVCFLRVFYEFY